MLSIFEDLFTSKNHYYIFLSLNCIYAIYVMLGNQSSLYVSNKVYLVNNLNVHMENVLIPG